MTRLHIIDINTINDVKKQVEAGKKSIKAIAEECRIYEHQADCEKAQAIYARLSDCKNRKEFAAVFATI